MKMKHQKYRLKIPSVTENLHLIRDFIIKIAEKAGFDEPNQEQIALAVDEACTNVIKHAYKFDSRRLIDIQINLDPRKMMITITAKTSSTSQSDGIVRVAGPGALANASRLRIRNNNGPSAKRL